MPADPSDLCLLADVNQWLLIDPLTAQATAAQIAARAADQALIQRLITSCSNGIVEFVQRPIKQAYYQEAYNGTGTAALVLKNGPISSVQSLVVAGVTVLLAPNPQTTGYLFKGTTLYLTGNGVSAAGNGPGGVFTSGNLNVLVSYTAGYATVPDDIAQACIEFVSFKYNQRKHIGRKSDNITGAGMSTSYQEGGMPPEVIAALNRYRRMVPS